MSRADTLHESKTIHDDIWRHIASADILVVDVTGLNPNVMMEYGVAAALRRPQQVILIKSEDDPSRVPFNAFAQRYLTYRRSLLGDNPFIQGLFQSMIQAVTPAPYVPPGATTAGSSGFNVDLRHGDRPDLILSPAITHRRVVQQGVEFGSFYVFRNSWLLLTGSEFRNVRARLRFRFQSVLNEADPGFLGLSVRNQHFHANWGHLVTLWTNGVMMRTEPEDDRGTYKDVTVGALPDFDFHTHDSIDFTVQIDEERLSFQAGCVAGDVRLDSMPYVYGAGKVRAMISKCRVLLEEIELVPV